MDAGELLRDLLILLLVLQLDLLPSKQLSKQVLALRSPICLIEQRLSVFFFGNSFQDLLLLLRKEIGERRELLDLHCLLFLLHLVKTLESQAKEPKVCLLMARVVKVVVCWIVAREELTLAYLHLFNPDSSLERENVDFRPGVPDEHLAVAGQRAPHEILPVDHLVPALEALHASIFVKHNFFGPVQLIVFIEMVDLAHRPHYL